MEICPQSVSICHRTTVPLCSSGLSKRFNGVFGAGQWLWLRMKETAPAPSTTSGGLVSAGMLDMWISNVNGGLALVNILGWISMMKWCPFYAGHDFPIVFYFALGGFLLSYIYSAPPLKLKKRGPLLL